MRTIVRCLSCLFVFICLLSATANSETVALSGSLQPGLHPLAQGFDFVITDHFPGDVSPDGMDYQKLESVHVGQHFYIVAILINRGSEESISSLGIHFYLDGKLNFEQTIASPNSKPIPSNLPAPLWVPPLSFTAPGSHTYRLEIAVPEDVDPSNNVVSGTFEVLPAAGEVPTPEEITPTNTPTKGAIEPPSPPTPTPPPDQDGFVVIERLFMVLDDGDSDPSNDVEVTEPEVGQGIRFCANIRNPGTTAVTGYLYSVDLGDLARPSRQPGDDIAAGASITLQSDPWTATTPGSRTVLWIFNEGRRSSPTDPSRSLEFTVVESSNTTPTPPAQQNSIVVIERLYLVLDDADSDPSNDVEVTEPEVGQRIRFCAEIRNPGTSPVTGYLYSVDLDNKRNLVLQPGDNIAAGASITLQSDSWTATPSGLHTVSWFFVGVRPTSMTVPYFEFTVVESNNTTPPTATPFPTRPGSGRYTAIEFERVFLVLNDGDNDLSNDVEIESPELGQEILFRADIRNTGTEDMQNYLYFVQANGGNFLGRGGQSSRNFLAAGEVAQLLSPIWRSPMVAGSYTVTWIISPTGRRPSSSDPTYEHHFTVIDPSGDITPTPSAIQTPTVEPTPTSTPTSETTPTATPTAPRSGDSGESEFDGGTLMASGWAEIPGGFTNSTPGSAALGDVAGMIPDSEDGRGLQVTVQEGQVCFLYGMAAIQTKNRPVLIRARVIADSPDAVIALVAFKGSITGQTLDGSMALNTSVSTADYMSQARDFVLVYQPNSSGEINLAFQEHRPGTMENLQRPSNGGEINLAFQVAAPPNAGQTTVYVDKIEYQILHADQPYFGRIFDFVPDESNMGRR